jgi:broad specificity phosphatase PhoE
MKNLYFVRHGLSEMNVSGHYSGAASNTPLTMLGKKQATAAGKWARENGIIFDIILASPLDRAHETARNIATEIGYNHDEIVLHEGLKERHFGSIEGVHSNEVNIDLETYRSDPYALDHIENIEKIEDMQQRANDLYKYIQTLPYDSILIVSHGSFGRALKRAIDNKPITEFGESIENAKIIKLI